MVDETVNTGDTICPICGADNPHWHYVAINRWGDSPFIKLESTIGEDITESEIWADLDKVYMLPPRQPGDIDVNDMMEHYKGLSPTGARSRMDQMVRTGEWEMLTVSDDTSGTGKRKIIRRVNSR